MTLGHWTPGPLAPPNHTQRTSTRVAMPSPRLGSGRKSDEGHGLLASVSFPSGNCLHDRCVSRIEALE